MARVLNSKSLTIKPQTHATTYFVLYDNIVILLHFKKICLLYTDVIWPSNQIEKQLAFALVAILK